MNTSIVVKGAREHNLKNLSVSIPKNKLVVLTGPSGSGKSTLVMDTLFKECQRQYLESMGMQGINKPKVDSISGLSPAISINQEITNRNPRSTVGTVTDMYTSLRMIFEKLGERNCPKCNHSIQPTFNVEEIEKEEGSYKEYIFCPHCNNRMERLTRTHFSYNTTEGACPTCKGLGEVVDIHLDSVFHPDLSIEDGAVDLWKGRYKDYQVYVVKAAFDYFGVPIKDGLPLKDFSPEQKAILYYGVVSDEVKKYFPNVKPPKTVDNGKFEGVLTGMWRRFNEKSGASAEAEMYFYSQTCPDCEGDRLNEISRSVIVGNRTIPSLVNQSLDEILNWINRLEKDLEREKYLLVENFIQDLQTKLNRINNIGLGYLTLDRQVITLSGGEAQRLRLSALLDSALTGVVYIMDEPTVGLHPKDTLGLVNVLKRLRDLGNTVLLIEHDVDVMKEADYIIDIGPKAGTEGGTVVGQGTLQELMTQEDSVTGNYLRREEEVKLNYRKGTGEKITVHHATVHNLKDITVSFPIGCLTAVTGVSGSGKSSLVFEVLAKGNDKIPNGFERVTGLDQFDQLIIVGQSPLSRMKRSNVATYIDVFTPIRNIFSKLKEAKDMNLSAKHFSFNTVGGRCENCQGLGYVISNMLFFSEMEVECPVCHGNRFKHEILTIKYNGHSINDILECSVQDALHIFQEEKKVRMFLELLVEIGLGYLKMGQSLTTLSGGEGQRLKLAKELLKQGKKRSLYLLDEPTTGLHPNDVTQLLKLLNELVNAGNTVIMVEHNSQMIRNSDWVIDLGPEGGETGGQIIALGTPEEIIKNKNSYTGQYL
ncbi:excinuclease ABC subunit UvrA [Pallidibacillus thermolactis]|uniref:excinuclease ABC subunit UvrA n=1 Tax=Pallidibacillus thermolactis TaxID=251051 RepID=UPI0021DB6818|nr:excinuclease ABC subunit UvrA [Pallidibacillus thermolactis]MCU9602115.1 excinuclease ABC subunit UvrA [Pallidibacillus thermolactis subsp. kokeshiiformis]